MSDLPREEWVTWDDVPQGARENVAFALGEGMDNFIRSLHKCGKRGLTIARGHCDDAVHATNIALATLELPYFFLGDEKGDDE